MDHILVRESVSYAYLTEKLGLTNVSRMVDPAFILKPETPQTASFWPKDNRQGVIGLNVSPLIERYKKPGQFLLNEVEGFIRRIVARGFSVLLIPHVMPLNGVPKNNDAEYMKAILTRCSDLGSHLSMSPDTLNAVQIKHVISQVRFFIGARTHATIAALSMGIPTVSIAYSIKARGINKDLFGDEWMVLPTPELSAATLATVFDKLVAQEMELRETLQKKMATYRKTVLSAIADQIWQK